MRNAERSRITMNVGLVYARRGKTLMLLGLHAVSSSICLLSLQFTALYLLQSVACGQEPLTQ